MQRHKGLLLLILTVVLGVIQSVPILAQDSPSSSNNVAILVVDVYDKNAEPVPTESVNTKDPDGSDTKCVTLRGEDGAAVRGNSVITSELHPYAYTHGELVVKHFANLLNASYTQIQNISSNPKVLGTWETERGNIWLTVVDTQKYKIQDIANDVAVVVNQLKGEGVKNFVINMSFALIPCKDMPKADRGDYIKLLNDMGIGCVPNPNASLERLACELDKSTDADYVEVLSNFRDGESAEDALAFAMLQYALVIPQVKAALSATIPEPPSAETSDFAALTSQLPNDINVVQVASAGNDGLPYPYYPGLNKNVLAVSAEYNPTPSCAPANTTDIADYLKTNLGFKDTNTTTPRPNPTVEEVAEEIFTPLSNKGEVITEGYTTLEPKDYFIHPPVSSQNVLGCLFGTSFAAPNLSVLTAFHLLKPDPTCLNKSNVVMPNPPLGHTIATPPFWDDATVANAANDYCQGFP